MSIWPQIPVVLSIRESKFILFKGDDEMSIQSYLILFVGSMLLGALCYAVSRPIFRYFGMESYPFNGTGLPMGVSLALSLPFGFWPVVISIILAGMGGLLGAYLFNIAFPPKHRLTVVIGIYRSVTPAEDLSLGDETKEKEIKT
jgi:hypothetical protein